MARWWLCSAEGSASTSRDRVHRRVRPIRGTISRRFEIFTCSCAATLLDAVQVRVSTRFAADASGFIGRRPMHEWFGDARARLASRVSRSLGCNLQMSFGAAQA